MYHYSLYRAKVSKVRLKVKGKMLHLTHESKEDCLSQSDDLQNLVEMLGNLVEGEAPNLGLDDDDALKYEIVNNVLGESMYVYYKG